MSTNIRFLIAVILVAVGPVGIYVIRERITPAQTRPPKQELQEMPARLGSWAGEQMAMDPRIVSVDDFDSAVSRRYENSEGDLVLLFAGLRRQVDAGFGHYPNICYRNAGYQITDDESLRVQVQDGSTVHARLLTVEREGHRGYVLFWYQRGEKAFTNSIERRLMILEARATKSWPPQIKVLLQTSAADADEARARLESIAVPLFEWTKQL